MENQSNQIQYEVKTAARIRRMSMKMLAEKLGVSRSGLYYSLKHQTLKVVDYKKIEDILQIKFNSLPEKLNDDA